MEVNKLESKEVFIMAFGGSTMLTVIILCSFYVGHAISMRSNTPTPITVTAAAPKIDIHVPEAPAPKVEVMAAAPTIDVHVPVGPAPIVNVAPAQVTVLDKREVEKSEKKEISPAINTLNLPSDAPKVIPVSAPTKSDKTSIATPAISKAPPEEEASLDILYRNAEGYIASYCGKKGINADEASRSWNKAWKTRVEQAINDNTDSSEQTFINRIVLEKRNSFLMDKATPEQIVEACRLLLRYRDGRLAMLDAMNEALTQENLKKTVVFLAAGPK